MLLPSLKIRGPRAAAAGLVLALVAVGGCSNETRTTGVSLNPIDSRLSLRLTEELGPQGRRLWLDVATERIYGCANFGISYRLTRGGQVIAIHFTGIQVPQVCATALGPAHTRIDLGAPSGTLPLLITVRGETMTGQLEASTGAFVLSGLQGTWTTVATPVLRRVPENTIWGLIGWSSETHVPAVLAYLDSLRALGAVSTSLVPGDYGHFQIDPQGEIVTPTSHGFYYAHSYLFHYEGSEAPFPGLVGAFADPLWISLYTDIGSSYFSWVVLPAARRLSDSSRPRSGPSPIQMRF